MLNISNNSIRDKVKTENFQSFQHTKSIRIALLFKRFLLVNSAIFIVILFLPWTQNVQGNGQITALTPASRPQTLQSPIPGKVDTWYVQEGDTVKQGDTLLFINEVKDAYFDPALVQRLTEEKQAKIESIENYRKKAIAQQQQVTALIANKKAKLSQTKLKITSDSTDVLVAEINRKNTRIQYLRTDSLVNEGLKSKYDLELRMSKWQEAEAKWVSAKNKFTQAKQELDVISAYYNEQIAKAESSMFSAYASQQQSISEVAKLKNKIANVEQRKSLYYLTAPQDAMVTKTIITGLSENIKEGQPIVELLPLNYAVAAEIYIRPVDLPLVSLGSTARLEFDGWPTIVFSGWPNSSFGTFPAKVVAIDNVMSIEKGGYRVLLLPLEENHNWPEPLRFGSGVRGFMLLKDVPVWYEIWRQMNGFPPEYYIQNSISSTNKKKS